MLFRRVRSTDPIKKTPEELRRKKPVQPRAGLHDYNSMSDPLDKIH